MPFQILLAAALLALAATTSQAAEKLKVVSFSTILTEIAERVGKDHAEVSGLVKPGVDPHEFEPRPADLKLVSEAHLVLLSAKHMEAYVGKLQEATGAKGSLLEVGDKFPALKPSPTGATQSNSSPDLQDDPHWWQSIPLAISATKIIQDELSRLAPENTGAFAAAAAAYTKELRDLQKWAAGEMAKLPRNQRKLVTSHDAFQYFARDFGFTIHPIEGVSPEDQPSSKKVADLISTIRQERVKAIFLESIENPKVTQEITKETGAKIGGTLYADGLGEGEAATYAGMYRHNVQTIVSALR